MQPSPRNSKLSEIREKVGLSPLKSEFGKRFLAYKELVRPDVIMDTFKGKIYEHNEDFFFRSVHLGTECWAFVALQRLSSAMKQVRRDKNEDKGCENVPYIIH
jgi:hypothetical protein